MTCTLYHGTLSYHPDCTKGFSYYYNDCCNVKWYIAWNVIMWLLALLFIVTIVVVVRRHIKKKELKRQQLLKNYTSRDTIAAAE